MMISYKYPIFPGNIAAWKLAENLDACRWLYNRLLEDLNGAKEKGIKLKTYDTQNMIPYIKLENPKPNLVYFEDFPGINLISLDLSLSRKAAQIAVERRLRGADAAYVAAAGCVRYCSDHLGSRDAQAMPGRSGDNDAGKVAREAMIGKKLFGGSGTCWGRARLLATLGTRGGRLSALVCGRGRPVGPGIRRPLNPEWAFFGRMIIGLQLRHEPFR
jgi:predicted nucleic acid-binding protein